MFYDLESEQTVYKTNIEVNSIW